MSVLVKDFAYGFRLLIKNRRFAIAALLTLAIGIGANVAIFSVLNGVLLRPVPYTAPDRLMILREAFLPKYPEFNVAPGDYFDWRDQSTAFEAIEAWRNTSFNVTGVGDPERVRAARVTA